MPISVHPSHRHYPTEMSSLAPSRSGLLFFVFLVSATSLQAWSDKGHRVVALAAQENLSENAKRRVGYLLGKSPKLVEVATWADEVSRTRPETEAWHSITIPAGAEGVDLERDCPLGDCITAKVRDCIGIVRLAIKPQQEILEAFKMLVGLAADMHQPLLNGYPPARSKENSIVVLDGTDMPLIQAWDSALLDRLGNEKEVLRMVRQRIAETDTEAWKVGTLSDWTWETHQIAIRKVYPSVAETDRTILDQAAMEAASTVIVEQLAKSAIRLTQLLDVAWP